MGSVVAIHQPNYLPWLGYFGKIAEADVLVFLDDVQFSKNSYINRTRVLGAGKARWLTVPVSVHLGDPINRVRPARPDWPARHLDTLFNFYRGAPAFRAVWPRVEELYGALPRADIAASNRFLIENIARELGLACRFRESSEVEVGGALGDDRLVALTATVAPGGCYLSGRGGADYQSPDKFAAAGLKFRYVDFTHPVYDQGGQEFTPGLSVMDAVFRLGWAAAAELLEQSGRRP